MIKLKTKKEYIDIIGELFFKTTGYMIILITLAIFAFIIYKGSATFFIYDHSISEFLFSTNWNPSDSSEGGGSVGAFSYIWGSILVCLIAVAIAVPFALATSIFMIEIAEKFSSKLLRPLVDIMLGVPSVIFGWIALTTVVPFVKDLFDLSFGYSILSASIVLAFMIFPTITSFGVAAISSVENDYRLGGYALGSTRWQVIYNVVLPIARWRIITGVVLGLSRAFGEALAVAMVIGKVKDLPDSILSPSVTLTTAIASDMGGVSQGGEHYAALWSMALLVLLISFFFILIVQFVSRKSL